LRTAPVRHAFRPFPVRSKHPRAWAAASAAEAASRQGRFWEMHDALFADQGRLEDPHLWARAETLGLDLERFETDRRSSEVEAAITAHFRAALRGGVMSTPGIVWDGRLLGGRSGAEAVLAELGSDPMPETSS
jgi:protein-disulfide isomerase